MEWEGEGKGNRKKGDTKPWEKPREKWIPGKGNEEGQRAERECEKEPEAV